ncbi:glycosyltransferase family 4 protein [Aestuariicoccus sp. MJ-SS9]|nr:glycosyltransferase family 4 protein [Aestuariicoccus sp. MJ-SS9]
MANGILGWKTYSRRLETVLSARDDIELSVLWRRPNSLSTLPVKRHDGRGWTEVIRRFDPITAYRGYLGADIRAAVRRHRPDLVHFAAHWPSAALGATNDGPAVTAALDCTRENINALKERRLWSEVECRRENALFHAARHLFPMSHWAARSLEGDSGVASERITIIPPAVDLSLFHPPLAHDGPVNIVFVGNDFQRKGGPELVSWVQGPLAGTCHLHIVSHDPAARVSGPHVTAHGPLPQEHLFGKILPRMDIFCLPTALDMSPQVLAEAAAAGLPAVASDIGGIPDQIVDGETGLLVRPGEPGGYVSALRMLIDDPERRAGMKRAARARAEAHFDAAKLFSTVADRLAELARHDGGRAETT